MRRLEEKSLFSRWRFFISHSWSFNRLKKIGAIYRKETVYVCKNRMGLVKILLVILATAIIIMVVFSRDIFFGPELGIPVLYLMVPVTVVFLINFLVYGKAPGSIKLERGYLLINWKKEEVRHDINSVVVRYNLIRARPPFVNLYIENKKGELLNQINARGQRSLDVMALVHLINFLKNNELSRLENLTEEEFLNIDRMSLMHRGWRDQLRDLWR